LLQLSNFRCHIPKPEARRAAVLRSFILFYFIFFSFLV
jgi:hypothetical protein